MSEERIPADYTEMDLLEAKRFDKKVKENFTPAIISTVKQIIEDYGVLEGVYVDVGCGTAVFRIRGQVLQYNKRDSRIYWYAYTTVSGVIEKIKTGR